MRSAGRALLVLLACVGTHCRGPEGPAGPGSEELTDPNVKPRVLYTSPAANSTGPYLNFNATIVIRFNKIMDLGSLRRALQVSSPGNDAHIDTAAVSSTTGDLVSVTVASATPGLLFHWQIGQTYTLRIDTTAEDVNGNRLLPGFSMTMLPEPFFRVTSISPADHAGGVSTLQQPTIRFNSVIDTSLVSHIRITPPLEGAWTNPVRNGVGPDSSMIAFTRTSELRLETNTTYTITMSDSAHDAADHPLRGGFSSSFTTVGLGVEYTSPSNGAGSTSPGARQIIIQFTGALDTSTMRNGIRISPALPGLLYSTPNPTIVYCQSPSVLPTGTSFEVVVDTTLRSSSGGAMAQPYRFRFSTENFRIVNTSPPDGDTNAYPGGTINIVTNGALDPSSAQDAFSLSPPDAGLFSVQSQTVLTFSPVTPLETDAWYTVTISTAWQSTNGDHLAAPYTFRFRTMPFQVLSSNPRDGFTGYPTGSPLYFYFSLALDTSSIRTAFHISPGISGETIWGAPPTSSFYFVPAGGFAPYTIYTVAIDTTLRSGSGRPLSAPYRMTFATGG